MISSDLGVLEQLAQEVRHGNFGCGTVHDRLADGAQSLGKLRHRMFARHIARVEMHLGDAGVIAGDEAVEDFGEETPLLHTQAAHDAEIDGDDVTVRIDE